MKRGECICLAVHTAVGTLGLTALLLHATQVALIAKLITAHRTGRKPEQGFRVQGLGLKV